MKSKREVPGSPLANGECKMSAARNGKLARPFEMPRSRAPLDSPADSASESTSPDARWAPALARIRSLVAAPVPESAFLDGVIRMVVDVLGVPHGKILALESSAPWLTVKAGVGWKPGTVGHARVSLGSRSQAGLTLRMGSAVVCPDLARTRRFAGATLLRKHGVVSTASAVIGASERPYGVMSVHTTRRHDFTPAEIQFLSQAAQLVSAGISARRSWPSGIDRLYHGGRASDS